MKDEIKLKELLDRIKQEINDELNSSSEYIKFCENQDVGIFDNVASFENGYDIKPVRKVKGINIYHMPLLMIATTSEIAITMHLFDDSSIILVDDLFNEIFTDKEKEFIIYHEIGHILDKDNNANIERKEFTADNYSLRHVNKDVAISAMTKTRDILEYLYAKGTLLMSLFDERIKRIENSH